MHVYAASIRHISTHVQMREHEALLALGGGEADKEQIGSLQPIAVQGEVRD